MTTRSVLLVTVGTDHHRFDRLVRWTDAWVERRAEPLDYLVQHGSSGPSRLGDNLALLPQAALLKLIGSATVVVAQGGPGSIVDARSCGRIPIVVPRLRRYDEVVDDHQVPFCALMSRQGACLVAGDEPTLHALLDRAFAAPERMRCPVPESPAPATAQAIRGEFDRVIGRPSGWVDLHRLREVWLRPHRVPGGLAPLTLMEPGPSVPSTPSALSETAEAPPSGPVVVAAAEPGEAAWNPAPSPGEPVVDAAREAS